MSKSLTPLLLQAMMSFVPALMLLPALELLDAPCLGRRESRGLPTHSELKSNEGASLPAVVRGSSSLEAARTSVLGEAAAELSIASSEGTCLAGGLAARAP